jgi:hypothetical protein
MAFSFACSVPYFRRASSDPCASVVWHVYCVTNPTLKPRNWLPFTSEPLQCDLSTVEVRSNHYIKCRILKWNQMTSFCIAGVGNMRPATAYGTCNLYTQYFNMIWELPTATVTNFFCRESLVEIQCKLYIYVYIYILHYLRARANNH